MQGILFALVIAVAIAAFAAFAAIPALILLVPFAAAGGIVLGVVTVGGSVARGRAATLAPRDDTLPPDPRRPGSEPFEPAWRGYLYEQAGEDLRSGREAEQGLRARGVRSVGDLVGSYLLLDRLPKVFLGPLVAIVVVTASAAWVGSLIGASATSVALRGVVATLRFGHARVATALRRSDERRLRARGAGATCVEAGCLGHARRAAVRCTCGRHHLEVHPGVHGLRARRCGCGRTIPHRPGELVAQRRLAGSGPFELVCPWCRSPLPEGTMTDRDVRIAVAGPDRSWRSRLVVEALGELDPPRSDDGAGTPADDAVGGDDDGRPVVHARDVHRRIDGPSGRVRLHLLDPASGVLADEVELARCRHLRGTHGVVLTVRPGSAEAHLAAPTTRARDAIRDTEIAYNALSTHLDDAGVSRRDRAIAVVVVLAAGDVEGVLESRPRAWLLDHGGRNLVLSLHRDAAAVSFFVVEEDDEHLTGAGHPVAWIGRRICGVHLTTGADRAGSPARDAAARDAVAP